MQETAEDELIPGYEITPAIESRLIEMKVRRRLEFARQWKKETSGSTLPDERDFDDLVPDTDDVAPRSVKGIGGIKPHDRNETKKKNGGTIGLTFSRASYAARAVYRSKFIGEYGTYAEAAAAYDQHARKVEGPNAILNDPEAVKEKDQWLTEVLRNAGKPRFKQRAKGTPKWIVKIPGESYQWRNAR
jgi:hypothetical protein